MPGKKNIYSAIIIGAYTRYTNMPIAIVLFFFMWGCEEKTQPALPHKNYKMVGEIPVPDGYARDTTDSNSFSAYLKNLPLKKDNTVFLYNGKKKENQDAQYAVIDMEIGKRDLQQCADAVMRLRAEYLFGMKEYKKIHFNFTNGERADYVDYAEGHRPVLLNNQVRWAKTAKRDYSYPTFRKYMDVVFTYAGTLSLNNELKRIIIEDIKAGDVFIQTGYPFGHAVIVMAVATEKATGKKAFMLAQSFMPAQDIHLLKNPDKNDSPWFFSNFGYELKTPEWTFKTSDLKRFPD